MPHSLENTEYLRHWPQFCPLQKLADRSIALLVCPAVFRGFWTVLIIVGLLLALSGGFLLVCGVPFISHKLYRLGGAFLIAAGKIQTPACLCVRVFEFTCVWLEGERADTSSCRQLLMPVA